MPSQFDKPKFYDACVHGPAINDQLRRATLERIASYTVGIAVEKNTGVGTGMRIPAEADQHSWLKSITIPV